MKVYPHVQRGLVALVVLLLAVSVARLLVSMHQQDERIAILEAQVNALMSDTTRMAIASAYTPLATDTRRSYRPLSYQSRKSNNKLSETPREESIASDKDGNDYTRKFTEPHVFDLNTVDSVTLIRIPGIAARTASVILRQRQRYGGFYDANQLRDFLTWDAALAHLDEWCTLWFTANAERIVHVPVNTATVTQLQQHPYLSHKQAVEIVQFRTRHKGIHQASDLQQLSTLSDNDISHLLPYLSFE